MKNKIHRFRGSWLDMHDKPVSFNARRYHKVEPHEGHMWAIAAYTLTAFRRCSDEKREELISLCLCNCTLAEDFKTSALAGLHCPRGVAWPSGQFPLAGLALISKNRQRSTA